MVGLYLAKACYWLFYVQFTNHFLSVLSISNLVERGKAGWLFWFYKKVWWKGTGRKLTKSHWFRCNKVTINNQHQNTQLSTTKQVCQRLWPFESSDFWWSILTIFAECNLFRGDGSVAKLVSIPKPTWHPKVTIIYCKRDLMTSEKAHWHAPF